MISLDYLFFTSSECNQCFGSCVVFWYIRLWHPQTKDLQYQNSLDLWFLAENAYSETTLNSAHLSKCIFSRFNNVKKFRQIADLTFFEAWKRKSSWNLGTNFLSSNCMVMWFEFWREILNRKNLNDVFPWISPNIANLFSCVMTDRIWSLDSKENSEWKKVELVWIPESRFLLALDFCEKWPSTFSSKLRRK